MNSPSEATLKRLFARCGNRCAFPRCPVQIFDGRVLFGEACHIKGAKPSSARYDPNQTPEERYSYENLIVMCANHHGVIDADEESYTVGRLRKLKTEQENASPPMDDQLANRAAILFMDNSIKSINQSGGITAETVHIENYHAVGATHAALSQTSHQFVPAATKRGQARFRPKDHPLGLDWDLLPQGNEFEVFLAEGSAIWLRVMPVTTVEQTWTLIDLHKNALSNGVCLQPLLWTNLRYLRAEDGFGTYSVIGMPGNESQTESVAFALETGEVWAIDTYILRADMRGLDFVTIASSLVRAIQRYGVFLQSLGIAPPFNWIGGLEGVKNRVLRSPSGHVLAGFESGRKCLSETVSARGTYDMQQSPGNALQPVFNQLFHKCGAEYPRNLRLAVEK